MQREKCQWGEVGGRREEGGVCGIFLSEGTFKALETAAFNLETA